MKIYEERLVDLLNSYLKQNKISYSDDMNFKHIIDEARSHSIDTLIYKAIKFNGFMDKCEVELLENLKKKTILTAFSENSHVNTVATVLNIFQENNIPVIVLKGLVVRDLYPNADLRTMGDADILVHEHNLEKVSSILSDLGYSEDSRNSSHIVFKHNRFKSIEVHWTLINEVFFRGNVESFERNLWNNAMEVKVGKAKALSLGLEDLAIHLCIHMATHIVGSGFGIRQLCDLVLLVDKHGDEMDWLYFRNEVEQCGVEKFTIAIFRVCNKLFGTHIPKEILNIDIDEIIINELINDIFSSGVLGRRGLSRMFANQLACNFKEEGSDSIDSMYKRFFNLMFPAINDMGDKYNYAKKNKVLAPVAWGHHLVNGAFHKKYSIKDKINFAKNSVSSSTKRNKLIKDLDL
ncbi:MAG: nucleotidyltransferase domain-containing protein [Sarcina sp.]